MLPTSPFTQPNAERVLPVRHTYNTQELAAQLRDAYKSRTQIAPQAKPRTTPQAAARPDAADPAPTAPTCPKCSSPMALRTAKKGKNTGQQFYGCTNYPKCKTILPTQSKDHPDPLP